VTQSEIKAKFRDFFIDFVRFMIQFLIIIDKIIVFGDPCGLHTIEMNKHDVSRLQKRKQTENPSIFSKVITVLFPNNGNMLKYRNVHNFHFNGVLNSFSLCMTVGVVSVILSMICLFIMFLTK